MKNYMKNYEKYEKLYVGSFIYYICTIFNIFRDRPVQLIEFVKVVLYCKY